MHYFRNVGRLGKPWIQQTRKNILKNACKKYAGCFQNIF